MGTNSDANFDIDQDAVHYVEGVLTGRYWELSKLDPDRVGLDRRCVLRNEDRYPERNFYIQIKGRGRQIRKGKVVALSSSVGFISQGMEIEHLKYYVSLSEPVFLVVVDVSSDQRSAYWLFLQQYTKELKPGWDKPLAEYRAEKKKQKPEITVKVPVANSLSDTEKLKTAVRNACGYMLSIGIDLGIAHEEDVLRRFDPRFDVNITVGRGRKEFYISSSEDVDLTLTAELDEDRASDLLGRGMPISFAPGEIKIQGSTLWENVIEKVAGERGSIQFKKEFGGFLNLIRRREGEVVGRFDVLSCHYEGGHSELRIKATVPHGLLKIEGRIGIPDITIRTFSVVINIGQWLGLPLLRLPLFEYVFGLLGNWKRGGLLGIDFLGPGGVFCTGNMTDPDQFDFSEIGRLLGVLSKTISIAKDQVGNNFPTYVR